MSVSKKLLVSILGCLLLTAQAVADDAGDVESAVRAWYDALGAGDAAGVVKYAMRGSSFPRHGGLLRSPLANTTQESRTAALQASFDGGLKYELRIHHLDVQVHGEMAVATYYTTGPTTYPDGTVLNRGEVQSRDDGRQRFHRVRVRLQIPSLWRCG